MKKINSFNSDEEVIENYTRWFNFFLKLPVIAAIIYGATCVILGLILLKFSLMWGIAVLFLGTPGLIPVYAGTKLATSFMVLLVYCAKQKPVLNEQNIEDELPEI